MRGLVIRIDLIVNGVFLVGGHGFVGLVQGLTLRVEDLLLFLLARDQVVHICDLQEVIT